MANNEKKSFVTNVSVTINAAKVTFDPRVMGSTGGTSYNIDVYMGKGGKGTPSEGKPLHEYFELRDWDNVCVDAGDIEKGDWVKVKGGLSLGTFNSKNDGEKRALRIDVEQMKKIPNPFGDDDKKPSKPAQKAAPKQEEDLDF